MVVVSRKLGINRTNRALNPGPVVCESITLSVHPQLLRLQLVLGHLGGYVTKHNFSKIREKKCDDHPSWALLFMYRPAGTIRQKCF